MKGTAQEKGKEGKGRDKLVKEKFGLIDHQNGSTRSRDPMRSVRISSSKSLSMTTKASLQL
jgi:hypothetical protein